MHHANASADNARVKSRAPMAHLVVGLMLFKTGARLMIVTS
jgi:hypothetical protein